MAASALLLRNYEQSRAPLQRRSNDFLGKITQVIGQVAPPSRETICEREMARSWGTTPRTFHDSSALQQDVPSMKKQVRLALVSDYGDLKSSHKKIARDAGCSPRTVESWIEERSLPGFEYIWRLAATPENHAIQKMMLRLIGMDPDQDREYHAAFIEFMRAVRAAR